MKKVLHKLTPYFFIGPHMLFFVAFLAFPVFYGIYISLHNYELLSFERPFVGLDNFLRLFDHSAIQSEYFWKSVLNTLIFVVTSVPALIIVGLALAVLIEKNGVGKGIFRSTFYTPVVLSITSITLMWRWILDTQSGLINYVLSFFGVKNIAWLSTTKWAWFSLVLVTVWWTVGRNMLLFIAGLQEIPHQLYEAAEIDGANAWKRFRYITLPSLRPTTLFVTVITTIDSFNIFGQPFMMTNGGPGRDTLVAMMYIREEAFVHFRLGSAAAMALVLSLFIIAISIIQYKLLSTDVKY